ncbi:MAG: universal stress protein [Anaerolineae bacterium]|jgi:nucleotide-binding universal stress UspA family protein
MFEKVLVPLDGSEMARAVLPFVEDIAQRYSAEIILLQVIATPQDRSIATVFQPSLAVPGSSDDVTAVAHPVYREQEMESLRAEGERRLSPIRKRLREEGLKVRIVVLFGRPSDRIVDFAEKEEVDLIALSTYGRSGLGRWAFGSVTKRVMRATAIPVLLIRPPA